MKGQLTFDVFIALFIFIGIVVYLFFQILTITPSYLNEINKERLKSEAYQISEILINDPGEPINWDALGINQIKRIGLSDSNQNKTNLVSLSKTQKLNETCSNYNLVKSKLGISDDFSIVIVKKLTNTVIVNCTSTSTKSGRTKIVVKRLFAFDDSTVGELKLKVW
jgi:hypothetical protein